jgi:hypothetical protein
MRVLAAIAVLIVLVAPAMPAQTPDPATLGPRAGERVPEFTRPDQHGVERSLRSLFGPKGAVLVFFRSADW